MSTEEYLWHPDYNGPKQQLNTNISNYDYQYLKFLSYYNGLPINAIITTMIEEDMSNNPELCRIFDGLYKQKQEQ
ncbi:hypothetical protein D3C75_1085460 [compost metagenome]